ncbi:hypothetical protein CHS0354_002833 [Potamilus streckersoni]|uniref:Uncharacterized protein n=1 Tax=Potamilus streckersoni TaxID=2493646 RepID=A0AAE0RMV4_9BIVA|nr:hypothetical protein CHS0354_002833 [Potamilus streckersoni]
MKHQDIACTNLGVQQTMVEDRTKVNIKQMSASAPIGSLLTGTQSGPHDMFGKGTGGSGNSDGGSNSSNSGTDAIAFTKYLSTTNQQLATMFTNPESLGAGMNSAASNFEPVNMFGTGTGRLGNTGSISISSTSGTDPTAFMQYLVSINQQLATMFTNSGSMLMGINSGSGNFAGFGSEA